MEQKKRDFLSNLAAMPGFFDDKNIAYYKKKKERKLKKMNAKEKAGFVNGVKMKDDTIVEIDTSTDKVIIPPNAANVQCSGILSQVKCLEISNVYLLDKFADLPKKLILNETDLFGVDNTDVFNINNHTKIETVMGILNKVGMEWIELNGDEHFTTKDGILYTKDMKSLIKCPRNRRGEVVIPDGVKYINDKAFYYCRINSVIFPDSVEAIGRRAFYTCVSLKHISFGNKLKSIGEKAFACCFYLDTVDIPPCVTFVKNNAFDKCSRLSHVNFHNGIECIELGAFYGCDIQEVILPDSLRYIGACNFENANVVHLNHIPENFVDAFTSEGWYDEKRQSVLELHIGNDIVYMPQSLEYNGREKIRTILEHADRNSYWSMFLYANEGLAKNMSALYTYLAGERNEKLTDFLKKKEERIAKELLSSGSIKEITDFLKTDFVKKGTLFELLEIIESEKLADSNISEENISVAKAYILQAIEKKRKEETKRISKKFQL